MPENWFYNCLDGRGVQGPHPLEHLVDLLHKGELAPNHQLRCGALGQWAAADDLKWFYNCRDGSGVHGPVTRTQLAEFFDAEILSEKAEAREGALGEWQPLTVVLGKMATTTGEFDSTATAETTSDDDDFELNDEIDGEQRPGETAVALPEFEIAPDEGVSPNDDLWYCNLSGQVHGPLPWSRVHTLASMGRVKRSDQVRHATDTQWKSAGDFPGLFPKSEPEAAQSPPPSEPQQWFCQLGGIPMGPISTEQLHNLIAEERIKPDDWVRPADADEWTPAATLPGLLEPPLPVPESLPEDETIVEPAPVAEEEKAAPPPAQLSEKMAAWLNDEVGEPMLPPEQHAPNVTPVAASVPVGKSGNTATAAFKPPAAENRARRGRGGSSGIDFGSLFTNTRFLTIAGVLAVAALLGGGYYLYLANSPQDISAYKVYYSFWEDYQKLREQKASDAEWTQFGERVKKDIQPFLDKLEKTATPDRASERALLFAGRDFIPKMLTDGRTRPCEAEKLFLVQMATVIGQFRDADLPKAMPDEKFQNF